MTDITITVTHRIELSPATLAAIGELARAAVAMTARQTEAPALGANIARGTTHLAPSASAPGSGQPIPAQDVIQATLPPCVEPSMPAPASVHLIPAAGEMRVASATRVEPSVPPPATAYPNSPGDLRPRWTDARKAVLRREYAAGMPIGDIMAMLNAMPGPPVERERIAIQAASMGVKRPAPSAAPPPAVAPKAPEPILLTSGRESVLRAKYEAGDALEEIVDVLNSLPGTPMTAGMVVALIGDLKLKRGPKFHEMQGVHPDTQPAPAPVPQASAPAPATQPAPKPVMTPERVAILERDYPTTRPAQDILDEMNRLPGRPVTLDTMRAYASTLKLKRPTRPAPAPREDWIRADVAEQQAFAAEVVDWPAALQWARNNKIVFLDGTTKNTMRQMINEARSNLCLPAWTIVNPRGVVDNLPEPHVGTEYAGSARA